MRISCPTCSQLMHCEERDAGKKAACPKCGQRVLIPSPPAPVPVPQNKTVLGKLEEEVTAKQPMPVAAHANSEAWPPPLEQVLSASGPLAPNRGVATMVLGIVSSSCCVLGLIGSFISPIIGLVFALAALPTGIIAWVMGHKDRRAIRQGLMSGEGSGFVLSGYICGIVGTSLAGLILMLCALASLSMLFCMAVWFKMLGDMAPAARPAPPPQPIQRDF